MSKSTFPGAYNVNKSIWIGGPGWAFHHNMQWLPYWMNGNTPLVGLEFNLKYEPCLEVLNR